MYSPNKIFIRKALLSDSKTLAEIQVASWKETYKGIIDSDYLNHLSVKRKERKWREILTGKERITFVLCSNDKILGYMSVGVPSNSSEKRFPNEFDSELYTLYLSPECPKRKGFGTMLFNKAIEYTKEVTKKEHIKMIFWVIGENKPAIAFYKKMGAKIIYTNARARFGDRKYPYIAMAVYR